jgi:hypothetical protein
MTQQDRERFVEKLKQTASQRAIPIDRLSCQGIPDKDGFQLTVESGGKKQVFTVSDSEAIKNPDAEIEALMNQISDNE